MLNTFNSILETKKIGFLEIHLVNQLSNDIMNIEFSKKKYFNILYYFQLYIKFNK